MRLFLVILVLCFPVHSAEAKWLRSESDHFVVYADDSEKDIRLFSEQLERYHSAMGFVTGARLERPSPSARVTVYVVSNERQVRKLHGGDNKWVAGFYVPRAGGSLAIVPRVKTRKGTAEGSMLTLLHEYAHHFNFSTSTFPVPRWLSEGSAEFFASASFPKDGGVGLGRPAMHRGPELFYGKEVTATDLLDPESYENRGGERYDAFYGKSWLLYHYLVMGGERKGQLDRYHKALISGAAQREAANEAFGDLDELENDLQKYLKLRRIMFLNIPPEYLSVGQVSVRQLTEGEAAMMPVRIRSKRGVDEELAKELVVEAREIAARYPDDPAVLAILAETEFDSGNNDAAIAAADAALAIDSSQVNAYVQKGYALFSMAEDAEDTEAAYKRAFAPFQALNRIENNHPLPLIYYYRGMIERGLAPSELAVAGLERAAELAPFDLGLRMTVANQQINDGKYEKAKWNLTPVAYNPHGGQMARVAQGMIEAIEKRDKEQ